MTESKVCFFFPGILGKDHELASFCTEARERTSISFQVVAYPGICEKNDLLFNFINKIHYLADIIERAQDAGPLLIAGYSYGGAIALEVARYLTIRGRTIECLAIIDAPTPELTFDLSKSTSSESLPARSLLKKLGMKTIERLIWFRAIRLFLAKSSKVFGIRFSLKIVRLMCRVLREKGRRTQWRPSPLDTKGVVIISSQFDSYTTVYWRKYSPQMNFHLINSRHLEIFSISNRYSIIEILHSTFFVDQKLPDSDTDGLEKDGMISDQSS